MATFLWHVLLNTVQGSRFFHENSGAQFFIRAVSITDTGRSTTNSTTYIDTLADGPVCKRDIPYFLKLNINTLMISVVDPDWDHTSCMEQLAEAGIFVIVALNGPSPSPFRPDGQYEASGTRDWGYKGHEHVQRIIDLYQSYPNTLGFTWYAGGPDPNSYQAVKAVVVHMKEYIESRNYRKIPIGLRGTGFAAMESPLADFVNCGDKNSSVDFFAESSYECFNKVPFMQSQLIQKYSNYSIPSLLFYGCNAAEQHNFAEVQDIFGMNGTNVLSGAVFSNWYESWDNNIDRGMIARQHLSIYSAKDCYSL